MRLLIVTALVALALALAAPAQTLAETSAEPYGGAMPATHAEWDAVHENGQTVPEVRAIIGSQGDEEGHGGGDQKYHIDFALAWRDDKVGRVTFSELTNLSLNKNVVFP